MRDYMHICSVYNTHMYKYKSSTDFVFCSIFIILKFRQILLKEREIEVFQHYRLGVKQ